MKKQTELAAVLSTAALLAIGTSMDSFAATGWAQEDGTWVYYNKGGDKVSDAWEKSGGNWYYIGSDGRMAASRLIEDGNYNYYVDENGVMASNKWIAIDNKDSDENNGPDHYWYYFQSNGKAMTNGTNSKVALKTINGKKYAFDSEGKMLYGWVDQDSAELLDNTDGNAFKQGTYYFGGEDDGAMTVGWLQTDITYDDAANDSIYKEIEPVFTDGQDQSRWFYFMDNGKKVAAVGNGTKDKTINGKQYTFDSNGAMIAEWTRNINKATGSTAGNADYTRTWRYFNSVEDGARTTRGWFKVIPAEMLEAGKHDNEESAWYYADRKGNLYANEIRSIQGKEYAFNEYGRMISGLKMVKRDEFRRTSIKEMIDGGDKANYKFDTEEGFNKNAGYYAAAGYDCYYFGEDGALKTGNARVGIGDGTYNFKFLTSGKHKGAGKTGEDSKKFYNSGKLVTAGKEIKYQVIFDESGAKANFDHNAGDDNAYKGYVIYDNASALADALKPVTLSYQDLKDDASFAPYKENFGNINLKEFKQKTGLSYNDKYGEITVYTSNHKLGLTNSYMIVNTSGNVSGRNARVQDGDGVYYKLYNGSIICTYISD